MDSLASFTLSLKCYTVKPEMPNKVLGCRSSIYSKHCTAELDMKEKKFRMKHFILSESCLLYQFTLKKHKTNGLCDNFQTNNLRKSTDIITTLGKNGGSNYDPPDSSVA